MSKVKRLIESYGKHITVPWRTDTAAGQRVIFCVYQENEELRLRAKIDEFELVTRAAGHQWVLFDLTDTFADWMVAQKYAQKYFQSSDLLSTLLPKYLEYVAVTFNSFLATHEVGENAVVVLQGVGSVFGFLKVKDVVDKLAPMVKGRLVVLFPGSYENNNYRLLDGYDGWNYLAVPITADKNL